jgi:octaprenyl-diphosphate synthase
LAASFPTPEICRCVASATNTVCAGEILQTCSRGDFNVSRSHYFKMVAMKTGELFAVSCDLGAYLSQATPARREALRQYGLALGTAYQLYDDCLDVLGTESVAGKSLGVDMAKGKMTLPVIALRESATSEDKTQLFHWLKHWEPGFLPAVVEMIEKYDGFAESRQVIQQYLDAARQAAMTLPSNDGRAGLMGLTEFLAEQTEALGVVY